MNVTPRDVFMLRRIHDVRYDPASNQYIDDAGVDLSYADQQVVDELLAHAFAVCPASNGNLIRLARTPKGDQAIAEVPA